MPDGGMQRPFDQQRIPADIALARGDFEAAADAIVRRTSRHGDALIAGRVPPWFEHPSNQEVLVLLAWLHNDDQLRNGGQSILLHFLCTANGLAQEPALLAQGYTPEFLAFISLLHDIVETAREKGFNDVEILKAAVRSWDGDEEERALAEQVTLQMTDERDLGSERIPTQAERTKKNCELAQYLRVYDKLDQIENDLLFFGKRLKHIQQISALIKRQIEKIPQDEISSPRAEQLIHHLEKLSMHAGKLTGNIIEEAETACSKTIVVKAATKVRPELIEKHAKDIKRLEGMVEQFCSTMLEIAAAQIALREKHPGINAPVSTLTQT